jgi:hypothetical protein
LQVRGKGGEFVSGAGEENEGCFFRGEAAGDGGADAHRGTGYEDGLIFEGHCRIWVVWTCSAGEVRITERASQKITVHEYKLDNAELQHYDVTCVRGLEASRFVTKLLELDIKIYWGMI